MESAGMRGQDQSPTQRGDAMNLTAETAAKVAATKHQDFVGHSETRWYGSNSHIPSKQTNRIVRLWLLPGLPSRDACDSECCPHPPALCSSRIRVW